MQNSIDFKAVNSALLSQIESIVADLVPGGTKRGGSYYAADITGGKGKSFSVNLRTGVWKDFADGANKGGPDVISLHSAVRGVSNPEAATELAKMYSITDTGAANEPEIKSTTPNWVPLHHAPDDAPPTKLHNYKGDAPSMSWAITHPDGTLAGYTARYELPDGSKDVLPWSWCRDQFGNESWRNKGLHLPRCLYGWKFAPTELNKAIIVEGEKTADAVRELTDIPVFSWVGGTAQVKYADWHSLDSVEEIFVIPDQDMAGYSNAEVIRENLPQTKILYPPMGTPKKWDFADLLPDGATVTREYFAEFLERAGDPPNMDYLPEDETQQHEGDLVQDMGDAMPPPSAQVQRETIKPPFRFLGYDHGNYFYLPASTKQILSMSAAAHQKNNLLQLAPFRWWLETFPTGGDTPTPNWTAITGYLFEQSHRAGIYDQSKIRGRGCWIDNGRVVFHSGDSLAVDGETHELIDFVSDYHYEAGAKISQTSSTPAENDESRQVLELCKKYSWKYPLHGYFLAGWCNIAPVCGILNWRPHIWITGTSGAGKTWIMDNFVSAILPSFTVYGEGPTTAPGIIRTLGSDAIPVIFDECETENQRGKERMDMVLEVARSSSSSGRNSKIMKASGDGVSATKLRSCFCFSSIGVAATQRADISRCTPLELVPSKDPKQFTEICELARKTVNDEGFCARIRARALAMAPTIQANVKIFVDVVSDRVGDRRLGDQLGTMLAGAYSLHTTRPVTPKQAEAWVEQHDWTLYTPDATETDENRALRVLLDSRIDVQDGDGKRFNRTIGEMIETYLSHDPTVTPDQRSDFSDTLKRYGIAIKRPWLCISNTNTELKKIFRDTAWADKWKDQFSRIGLAMRAEIEGIEGDPPKMVKFSANTPNRVSCLPVAMFEDERGLL